MYTKYSTDFSHSVTIKQSRLYKFIVGLNSLRDNRIDRLEYIKDRREINMDRVNKTVGIQIKSSLTKKYKKIEFADEGIGQGRKKGVKVRLKNNFDEQI